MQDIPCTLRAHLVAYQRCGFDYGYPLLKNSKILPIQILLSEIMVGGLLFTETAEPNRPAKAAAPR